jgi:leucyl-tRNA---protein transferase
LASLLPNLSHYPALPPPVRLPLTVMPDHPCPYLPDRIETSRGFEIGKLSADTYHSFMDAGFRRSGSLVYQPVCRGCRECRPIRLAVGKFTPSKSQRRCLRRNSDIRLTIAPPVVTREKFNLYNRYMAEWHGSARESRSEFESFLYESPTDTIEFTFRDDGGRLLAIGICDVCSRSMSSVYFYFDPAEVRRGLGTFGALMEIRQAQRAGIAYYYLGYWIRACPAMSYKSSFGPAELLDGDGVWREHSG